MGEVYRADDLTLDQPVALKFLPGGVADDDSRLAQFHNELRVARQVSHKNVCRLYDLGDADGRRFLTMEYVDGEDLASLLRRIGRIPQDKAVELARQLCAGVAAAHERGVLHRDLKPANVMIDGDGNVRITDFGIATAAGDADARDRRHAAVHGAGAARRASRRRSSTDIYALGLILFEIFTGRRAYDAKTLGDLKQLHDTGTVTTPSSIVRDLDPAIERVILRCLATRSGSAAAVGADGRGVAAGRRSARRRARGGRDTVAGDARAAGESEALAGRPTAWRLSRASSSALLVMSPGLASARRSRGWSPLDKPPAVLADRAEQILTIARLHRAARRHGLRLGGPTRLTSRGSRATTISAGALGRAGEGPPAGIHLLVSHEPARPRAAAAGAVM